MEDIRQCVTDANERKYGLWSLKDENTATRKCNCCGIEFKYPVNKWNLTQIKKQHEAKKILQAFLNLSLDDPNLIGYLNVVLDDVVDYIDDDSKSLLFKKFSILVASSFLDDENKLLLETLIFAIKSNDNDLFFDLKNYFEKHNSEELINFVDINKSKRTSNFH